MSREAPPPALTVPARSWRGALAGASPSSPVRVSYRGVEAFRATDGGCIVRAHVTPRSARPGVALAAGRVAIRVRAVPEKGRATAEAAERLADGLGVPRSAVRLKSGRVSRTKSFEVAGIAAHEAQRRLRGR